MFGIDIQCLPGDCVATTLLQCLKGSIKVDSVLDASTIAWHLQRMKKEDYDTEQANYEAQDPQAEYRSWEVFVRNAILVQILETKPRNRRVEIYNKGVLRGFGIRKLSARKKEQPNHDFHEARRRLAQRADDEYRRYCQRHPHRLGRNGRRGPQLDPAFENEDGNPPAMPYKEFFIRIDPSFYAIKRCAESMMDGDNGHKYTREPVYEAAPPLPPEPVHYNAAPPIAPFQEGGGSLSPSGDAGAFSANEGRGSSRASSHTAAYRSHGGGREPTQGSDHGAAIFSEPPHRQPNHPSEISHRPAASPTPSHRDPSRISSRASSDRHTTSSKASSRASSRAPSHTFSNRHMVSSASSPLSGTRAGSHAGFDESIAISASSARRPSRATPQASVYSANMRPSGLPRRQPIQAPADKPTSGSPRSPAATAGEAALSRAAIANSSQLPVPGNEQLRTPTQLGQSRMPPTVTVNGSDPSLSSPLDHPRSPYASSHQSTSDSALHYQIGPYGSKDGFLGAENPERHQSHQGSRASSHASNERSGRPPLPFSDSGSYRTGKRFATTNDYHSGGQPHLPSESGSRRATSNHSISTTPKASKRETPVVGGSRQASSRGSSTIVASEGSNDKEPAIGSGRASSRGSSSTTTRISKGKEPASRSNAERVADSSEPSSDENDIESISSWHSDGARGPPKWGNRERLAWEMVSGK